MDSSDLQSTISDHQELSTGNVESEGFNAPGNSSPVHSAPENSAPENSASENSAPKPSSPDDGPPNDALPDDFSPGNPSPDNSLNPPDTIFPHNNPATVPSTTPSHAATSDSTLDMYVLSYGATLRAHDETTDETKLLDETPITVEVNEDISPATFQAIGILGVYLSEAEARRVGKKWLYQQLIGLDTVDLPLPYQDGSDCPEPEWRRSKWQRMGDGSWTYSVSDYSPRMRALVVCVTERVLLTDGNDEEYRDSDDDLDNDGDDDSRNPEYVYVGSVRCKRVTKMRKEEEADREATENADVNDSDSTAGEGENGDVERKNDNAEAEGDESDIESVEL